ncbi:hypothetical protein GCM10011575_30550 [Microlunatus endophyticus]|uniref:Uncharacterized protein n=1 Tax=Microlunatus endophyticus TaxID=1716077 RepID=A0A917SD62_9ACTN|nr:hypothetical protein [Microlunatus endophyticus]GGL69878.1 hypothetical protein GCM10011575_30550 [Microlunatus endophyticus]
MAANSTAERSDDVQIVRVTPSQVRAAQILLELDHKAGREPRRSTLAIAGAGKAPVRIEPSASGKTDESRRSTATDRPRLA